MTGHLELFIDLSEAAKNTQVTVISIFRLPPLETVAICKSGFNTSIVPSVTISLAERELLQLKT